MRAMEDQCRAQVRLSHVNYHYSYAYALCKKVKASLHQQFDLAATAKGEISPGAGGSEALSNSSGDLSTRAKMAMGVIIPAVVVIAAFWTFFVLK